MSLYCGEIGFCGFECGDGGDVEDALRRENLSFEIERVELYCECGVFVVFCE